MIIGLGIDLADSQPWQQALDDPASGALEVCFTAAELATARSGPVDTAQRLAARYAAKEAFIKALDSARCGQPPLVPGLDLREVELALDSWGRPYLVLHRQALALSETLGVQHAWVSLSHEEGRAVAVVALEG